MSEKYGIQSVLKESIAQTPVSLSTVLVVMAGSNDTEMLGAYKASSVDDLKAHYSDANDGDNLIKAAKYVFEVAGIESAWFINYGDDASDAQGNAEALHSIYMNTGEVPSVVVLYDVDTSAYVTAIASTCRSIADHFKAQVFYNNAVPANPTPSFDNGYTISVSDMTKGCNAENAIACIGAVDLDGFVAPMSIVAACARVLQDNKNINGIPYRSVGNLELPAVKDYVLGMTTAASAKPLRMLKTASDALAAAGYVLAINCGQKRYFTWGDHTALVTGDGSVSEERARFDSYIAMAYHIANRFILKHQIDVDKPMTLALRNDIIAEEQDYLNYLVAIGALIGNPKCEFRSIDNTTDTIAKGEFHFTNLLTYAVPAKYIELGIIYTQEGLSSYLAEV